MRYCYFLQIDIFSLTDDFLMSKRLKVDTKVSPIAEPRCSLSNTEGLYPKMKK